MILGIETSCDETAAAVVTDDGHVLSSVVSSQADLHARYGGVVPEVASRRHLELVAPVVREALDVGRRVAGRASSGSPSRRARASSVRCSSESRRRRQSPGRAAAARPRRSSRRAPRVALPRAGAARAAVHLPARERRAHAAPRRARARSLRAARDDARRRCGRGVRQGGAAARPRLSGGAEIDRLARDGDAERLRVPRRARARARLLLLGAQDGAAVRRARARRGGDRTTESRSRGLVSARDRSGARAAAARGGGARPASTRSPSSAGSRRTRSFAPRFPTPRFAPLDLCTDNAAMIASARATSRRFRTLATLGSMRTPLSRSAVRSWRGRRPRLRSSSRATGARAQEPPSTPVDEAGWQGVLGVRAAVSTAQRYVVLLEPPSLAERVRAAGGRGDGEGDARVDGGRRRPAGAVPRAPVGGRRTDRAGVPVRARRQRVLGPARSDVARAARTGSRGEGVYPVRIAYPAQAERGRRRAALVRRGPRDRRARRHGRHGRAARHRRRSRRIPTCGSAFSPGVDVIDPGSGGIAQPHPTIPGRPERHGTELAGIIAGSEGPDGLHGIAPGASILPVRVGGWQPNAEGGYTVYSRTDQILAGLEAAVDPNDDGDAHDAARIALIGVVEPYAAFADGPLPRAIAGAAELDMLTIVPAGNDGRAGPGYGSIAGPGRRGRPSRSAPRTGGSRRRRSASTFAPGSGCCSRTTCRSAELRRGR